MLYFIVDLIFFADAIVGGYEARKNRYVTYSMFDFRRISWSAQTSFNVNKASSKK